MRRGKQDNYKIGLFVRAWVTAEPVGGNPSPYGKAGSRGALWPAGFCLPGIRIPLLIHKLAAGTGRRRNDAGIAIG